MRELSLTGARFSPPIGSSALENPDVWSFPKGSAVSF